MKKKLFFNSTRKPLVSIMLISMAGFSVTPAHALMAAENPWIESSKPLIDGNPIPSENNSWRANENSQSRDKFDESRYPPLDENEALGTKYSVLPSENAPVQRTSPAIGGNWFRYPQAQDFEQMPVYPDNFRRDFSAYSNRQYPPYQRAYQPGYPTRFGSGYNSMGGFPFAGNSGRGFPLGMGNGWMPFSSPGFW